MPGRRTAIVTGASRGIDAGLVDGFLKEVYTVVATSRHASRSLTPSASVALTNGDIGWNKRVGLEAASIEKKEK